MRSPICLSVVLLAGCVGLPSDLPQCDDAGCDAPRVCYKGLCLYPGDGGAGLAVADAGVVVADVGNEAPDAGPPINPATCGDGVVERGEACDDGNTNVMDDCDNNCRWRLDAIGGAQHTCLRKGTQMFCMGKNHKGQLGDNSLSDRDRPVFVVNTGNVVDMTATAWSTCALIDDGTVKCWGYCLHGVLGQNNYEGGDEGCASLKVPSLVEGVRDGTHIVSGDHYVCVRTQEGRAVCWGWNAFGSLGRGHTEMSAIPGPVVGLNDIAALSGGAYHVCALSYSGDVRCWGQNIRGQLGLGNDVGILQPSDPILSNVKRLISGNYHNCALTHDNRLFCWGSNQSGELGLDTSGEPVYAPAEHTGVAWSGVAELFAGNRLTCLQTTTDAVYCTGSNAQGQLGIGQQSTPNPMAFVQSSVNVLHLGKRSGGFTGLAVAKGNYFWAWGQNDLGQLGLGDLVDRDTPTCVVIDGQSCPDDSGG